jgi:MFS transporter, DHA1 family, solute carrier family 18 (vesicular amine transporter), member 1/2
LGSCNFRCVFSPRRYRVFGAHPTPTTGLFTDILVYSLIIPVIPYQLEALGYDGIGAKVSWLLAAFVRHPIPLNCSLFIGLYQSGTLVLATLPIAYYSEVYHNRKIPLLAGLVALIGSQIMFMEAPAYWLMVFARFLQGISSAVVWTVGLALL